MYTNRIGTDGRPIKEVDAGNHPASVLSNLLGYRQWCVSTRLQSGGGCFQRQLNVLGTDQANWTETERGAGWGILFVYNLTLRLTRWGMELTFSQPSYYQSGSSRLLCGF